MNLMFENLPKLNGTALVELTVDGSPILIEVDGNNAPITAGNFVDLVEKGFYDGVSFHRVVTEPTPFVVQGGDPRSTYPNFPVSNLGAGGYIDPSTGQERTIPLEIKLEGDEEPTYSTTFDSSTVDVVLEHDRGAIAMARSQSPDSASSQFYFALDQLDFLNGNYAVFGNIIEGLEVIDTIEQGDVIDDAEVVEGLENFDPGEVSNTISLFRFRNTNFSTGTYVFVSGTESDVIQNDSSLNQSFELEGDGNSAFKASTVEGDDLLPFYRIRNLETEGTYSFVSTEEYDAIFDEDSDQNDKWEKEGLDSSGEDIPEFYLYGAGAGVGTEFHRFQNNENGTFLFAGPDETANINNDPNLSATFTDQGVAFEALL